MTSLNGGRTRLTPVAILVALLAIIVLRSWLDAGSDSIELEQPAAGLDSVTWTGTVAPEGRLSVRITYDLSDDRERSLDIRVPDGARYLALNDEPIAADSGVYATVTIRDSATVSYELPGAVTRYRDGALLRLAGINDPSNPSSGIDGDKALFPCPRCYIDEIEYGNTELNGSLFLPTPDAVRLSFLGANPARAESSENEVRFVAIDGGADTVSMLAVLNADDVPGLPIRDGSVDDAIADVRDEMSETGESFHDATRPGDSTTPWPAIALTAIAIALFGWIVARVLWAAKAARPPASGDDHAGLPIGAPPSELEPAMAGAVVGELGPGSRSVVAATLLELARRDVVTLTGPDPRRVELDVPQGATGTTPFEQAVLSSLRPPGDPLAATSRSGPPIWDERATTANRLRAELARAAHRQHLYAMVLPLPPLVIGTLAIAILGIIARDSGAVYEWIMAFAGPVLALIASTAAGVTLTRRGLHERDLWARYADWLKTDPSMSERLDHADASSLTNAIAALGVTLPYAAALGAAPALATALSPRRDA